MDHSTYLFTWNPARFEWDYLPKKISEVDNKGHCSEPGSCSQTKAVRPGDRAFMMKQGKEPRGIFASGWVVSSIFEDTHWDPERYEKGLKAFYVDIDWYVMLDPEEHIFRREWLPKDVYRKRQIWDSQQSGVRLPPDIAGQLEKDWTKFLKRMKYAHDEPASVDSEGVPTFEEGETRERLLNDYKRSSTARQFCLDHYGHKCCVCGFVFAELYGDLGKEYMHVHHLTSISSKGGVYTLDPIRDLRPVCPNCHAMLHMKKPALTVRRLKARLRKTGKVRG